MIAGGDVSVQHGIAGKQIRIEAGGSVYARFINAATVRAHGDVIVEEYIHHASVKADGSIEVLGFRGGSRNSGAIVGGFSLAGPRIRAQHLGSKTGRVTQLVAGCNMELAQQAADQQKLIERYHSLIRRMLQALQLEKPDMQQIKQLLLRARGPRKKQIAAAVQQLMPLLVRCEDSVKEKESLDEKLQQVALNATIEVAGQVAAGTVLRIGDQSQKVNEEGAQIKHVKFFLSKKKGVLQLDRAPL